MIGDIRICIKLFFKRLVCDHDYRFIPDRVFMVFDMYECTKCGRTKCL